MVLATAVRGIAPTAALVALVRLTLLRTRPLGATRGPMIGCSAHRAAMLILAIGFLAVSYLFFHFFVSKFIFALIPVYNDYLH